MMLYFECSGGGKIAYRLNRRAKKNIIVRKASGCLNISVPPWLGRRDLQNWLRENENTLLRLYGSIAPRTLPDTVFFGGRRHAVAFADTAAVSLQDGCFRLPEVLRGNDAAARAALAAFFYREAQKILLPLLEEYAQRLNLVPQAVGLTRAKSFWGVCSRSRVRLNFRLIGAPEFVRAYVCVHELCHLRHADHSAAFWRQVRGYFARTDAAKSWLKTHGAALFWDLD